MEVDDLDVMREAWAAVDRYTVCHLKGYAGRGAEIRTVLHVNQPLQHAQHKAAEADAFLRKEPGSRAHVMSRPIIGVALEAPSETRVAYLELRRAASV